MDKETHFIIFIIFMLTVITVLVVGFIKWAMYIECQKPYINVCVETESHIVMIYNSVFKRLMPQTVSECVKTKRVKNECYKGETTE